MQSLKDRYTPAGAVHAGTGVVELPTVQVSKAVGTAVVVTAGSASICKRKMLWDMEEATAVGSLDTVGERGSLGCNFGNYR